MWDFERRQGHLRAQVRAERSATVVLPHYAFQGGWTAHVAGAPVEIGSSPRGLMRVALPAGSEGVLELRYSMTPMRKVGLVVSAAVLCAGTALLLAARRGSGR